VDQDSRYWDNWWRRRASRRNILRGAGGLGAAAFLAACQPSAPPPSSSNTGSSAPNQPAPDVPQVLKHGVSAPPVTWDPNGTALSSTYFYAVYDALTRVDEKANLLPGLAESWKSVDDTTWEFKVRQTKWSDGTPATADDVKFTYDYVLDPANKSAIASRIANVAKVTVVDPQTVRISTNGSDALMPKRAFFIPILPKAYISKVGMSQFSQQPIGTGAFKVKEYKSGTQAVLVPSENSWRKTKLTELWLMEIPDTTARVAGLRTGDLQAIDGVDRASAPTIQGDQNLDIIIVESGGSYNYDLEFFAKPYDDKRVRLAMNYAIDKASIMKNLLGGYGAVMDGQIVTKNTFGYNPNLKALDYDPKKAKDMLAAAGLSSGLDTIIEFTTNAPEPKLISQAMQQNFADIGIKTELHPVETAVWRDHIYNGGRPPVFFNPWSSQAPLDAEFVLNWYGEDSFNKKPYWKNQAFFDAYKKSQQETDVQKRLGYLQAASAAMLDDPPVIYMIQSVTLFGVAKRVKNIAPTPGSYVWYDDIVMTK
jgi:peptide/nickel transport system substrate-binding protein